jgi:hypothetical protein
MLGYLAGALTTGMLVGIAVVEWLSGSTVVSDTRHTVAPAVDFVFGLVFLLAAFREAAPTEMSGGAVSLEQRDVRDLGEAPMNESDGLVQRRWVVRLFGLAALLLIPWIVVLVQTLPSAHRAAHWDVAWAGFDLALALLLFTVAAALWRNSPWLEGAATAAATLLFVDAWFDVLTASTRAELVVSIIAAAIVELPLAVLCLWLAYDAELRLRVPRARSASPPPALTTVEEKQAA